MQQGVGTTNQAGGGAPALGGTSGDASSAPTDGQPGTGAVGAAPSFVQAAQTAQQGFAANTHAKPNDEVQSPDALAALAKILAEREAARKPAQTGMADAKSLGAAFSTNPLDLEAGLLGPNSKSLFARVSETTVACYAQDRIR